MNAMVPNRAMPARNPTAVATLTMRFRNRTNGRIGSVARCSAYAKATSRDTVRSRSFTGKPARMLRNDWTEAWEQPDNPKPLGMPLQYMVSGMAVKATHKYPNETVDVAFNPVGQVVGQFVKVEKTATVIERWVQEYLEATNTLNELNEAATS